MIDSTLFTRRGVLTAGAASLAVAACTPVPPDPPVVEPLDYASRRDGAHNLAAIDIGQVHPAFHRQVVPYTGDHPVGSIVIENSNRLLYLLLPDGYALRYGISVGRAGFDWTGSSTVYRRAQWPTWTPPPEMIERDPKLERWKDGQPGGPRNPLGARALYLLTDGRDQGYRIHGTPDWRSIGRFASSGCFRMLQQDVIDLYDRVPVGTQVIVA
ncbi:MAG: L,D-transpeptidase family protein [Alphaproteobacteria bacterium]|nr:L,D-transpeptidase family protein [Alphaproteobacteria bacterium]